MDTLVVIGDLTASESFSEAILFVQNDLFKVMKSVLTSPVINKIEPVFNSAPKKNLTKLKFWEMIVWTVANSVADDEKCRVVLLDKHFELIDVCFGLAEAKNE